MCLGGNEGTSKRWRILCANVNHASTAMPMLNSPKNACRASMKSAASVMAWMDLLIITSTKTMQSNSSPLPATISNAVKMVVGGDGKVTAGAAPANGAVT